MEIDEELEEETKLAEPSKQKRGPSSSPSKFNFS